ncbi:MAG: RnfABCDGE type electron transport complex subunit D [Oscillibacter sp.]|nr:RnfABCDGE type electron transport complex subunit D [Oscillibacter sp.]
MKTALRVSSGPRIRDALRVSSGPHVRDSWTTSEIMFTVALALLPAAVVGVWVNGLHALLIILTAIVFAVETELLFDWFCRHPATYKDGSAVVTGLLLALSLSPTVPLYIPALGSVFAILVVKCCFGGLGRNFVNPALAARCFLLISFAGTMTSYSVDATTSATPVAALMSGQAVSVTRMFLGGAGGVIGASIFALMLGGLALWVFDLISGWICFSILASFAIFVGLFGGQGFDPHYIAAQLCGGGVVMAAFFMATDYATSPTSQAGQVIYGVLIGVLGGVFRIFGSAADSFSYAVLVGNLCAPALERYLFPKPFAYRRARNKRMLALAGIAVVGVLAIVCAYSATKDTIAANRMSGSFGPYLTVFPEETPVEAFDATDEITGAIEALGGATYGSGFGNVTINEAYAALDADGNIIGYVVSATSADGNDGPITLAVGVNPDGVVNGIVYTDLNETPGIGMRCGEPEFTEQFAGKDVESFTLGTDIDGVSGATVTSTATVNAVNAALDFFRTTLKGGNV